MNGPPPDRSNHPGRKVQALNLVRGGAICDPGERAAHIMKGSYKPAACMPTLSLDPRPRWREAGKPVTPPSRHSIHFLQHRKGGQPIGKGR